ncbi:MAG: Hpt domain-containing protein [Thermoguttaceae bacterium]|jgi:HPt (histidine-containing phosphotransfer) domain-containing protein
MTKSSLSKTIGANHGIPTGQPMRGPSNANVLDLQGLCDRCMGNLDLVERVLEKFEQRLPKELAELEHDLQIGDAAKIALVAHRIKGNASNISATGLQQAAAEIEDLSRAGRVADVHAPLRTLREQWQRYVDCRATIRPAAADVSGHGPALNFRTAMKLGTGS